VSRSTEIPRKKENVQVYGGIASQQGYKVRKIIKRISSKSKKVIDMLGRNSETWEESTVYEVGRSKAVNREDKRSRR
jgi:hypothetical protein